MSDVWKWIEDFLSNSTQGVVVHDKASEKIKVTSGVSQGSDFGPILFLILINDI